MRTMPLSELTDYTMRIDLDAIPCTIRIYWVEFSEADKPLFDTAGCWYMDISNRIFTITGIKLVGGTELMWPYSHVNFGGFILYDTSDQYADPEFLDMGDRWQLYYIELDEIDGVRQALDLETF